MTTKTTFRARLARRLALSLGLALAASACKTGGDQTVTPQPQPRRAPDPVAKAPSGRKYPSPPPPTAPKPVNFPDVASFQLPNELTVYVIENHEVPIVTAQLVVRCGSMDDPYLAEFTASMLGEGTKSRSKAKLDEAIEFVGGELGAFASTHVSTVFASSLDTDLKLAILLMADEVLNPIFPAASLEKLKQGAKSALRISKSRPDALADTLFRMQVFPQGHPYGRPFATEQEIDAISVDDLRKFHQTFYRSNNAFLLLSGDITVEEARPLVERAYGSWTKAERSQIPPNPLNKFTRYELPAELQVHLVDRPDSAQASIRVGNLALARNHEDWTALSIANRMLGGGPNSRLFQDLREQRSLTYGINSYVSEGQAPGVFQISTSTRTPTTGAMLAGIFEHIERIRRDEAPRIEFEDTVRTMVGSFPLQVETSDQIVDKVKDQLIFGLPRDYWKNYRDAIIGVELGEIRKMALRYVHALPVVVVVGNAAEIEPQIKRVLPTAKIVKYDDQLQRK